MLAVQASAAATQRGTVTRGSGMCSKSASCLICSTAAIVMLMTPRPKQAAPAACPIHQREGSGGRAAGSRDGMSSKYSASRRGGSDVDREAHLRAQLAAAGADREVEEIGERIRVAALACEPGGGGEIAGEDEADPVGGPRHGSRPARQVDGAVLGAQVLEQPAD